ncbi:MAG TPA: hypothetical protein VGG10_10460 [Rhizomicrobium sp.]|jgi:hypothetical protein
MPFKRGAPKGNQNRFRHGLYSEATMARKDAIRSRTRIVRMIIQRVDILCRLHDALERKNIRLREARPVRYTRPLSTMIRRRGKLPHLRDLGMCIGSKTRQFFGRRREPMEPGFKLLVYWCDHYQKQDYDLKTVIRLIVACGLDPIALLAKC